MAPRMRGLVLAGSAVLAMSCGSGEHVGPGEVTARSATRVAVPATPSEAASGEPTRQILFGDLHTHTHFSLDAWPINMPLVGGEGVHPPADACDYARFCAALDFWSINDHAEGLTRQHWDETRDTVIACNAAAGDPANPDLVSFLGFEWSQVGDTAATHFGHKNVVFRETSGPTIPARAIAAPRPEFGKSPVAPLAAALLPFLDRENADYYRSWPYRYVELAAKERCPSGVDSRELPADCLEVARDPAELFEKLDQWGAEALVIPHGNTWGLMTPPRTDWAIQLDPEQQPERQTLLEIYSGHGNAEPWRAWRAEGRSENGAPFCPEPTDVYVPCCWRAGEIIRERCEDSESELCSTRVRAARQHFLDAGVAGYATIPGAEVADWRDCGVCPDCPLGAFDHRPGASAQSALASVGGAPDAPTRLRFGFLGSSDSHRARPGNGFKEERWDRVTDAFVADSPLLASSEEKAPESRAVDLATTPLKQRRYSERQASFYLTGGLVAVHAAGRSRDAIWDALQRREVYGTSGPRILLWFDVVEAAGGARVPMGSEIALDGVPRFRARALGARGQRPGCPESVRESLGAERTHHVCADSCYFPDDTRHRIEAIEVVRILPQRTPDEPLEGLIADPWKSLVCDSGPEGCDVRFEDPEFPSLGREAIYYVRAIQAPTPAINGDPVRCERDAEGRCVRARPCREDPEAGDCLAPVRERAWSSPIFATPAGG